MGTSDSNFSSKPPPSQTYHIAPNLPHRPTRNNRDVRDVQESVASPAEHYGCRPDLNRFAVCRIRTPRLDGRSRLLAPDTLVRSLEANRHNVVGEKSRMS